MTKRNLTTSIAVVAGLAVIALFFGVFNPFDTDMLPTDQSATTDSGGVTQLVAQDEVVGTGQEAQVGNLITVNYTGKLQNGTVFDTTLGKEPYQFTLGAGKVIQGWDQGIRGMKVGGKRLLIIPASLGYGATGYGPIPPNATLIFEVELVGIAK